MQLDSFVWLRVCPDFPLIFAGVLLCVYDFLCIFVECGIAVALKTFLDGLHAHVTRPHMFDQVLHDSAFLPKSFRIAWLYQHLCLQSGMFLHNRATTQYTNFRA